MEEVDSKIVPVKHAIIGITNDSHHESDGVKIFSGAAFQLLENQENLKPTSVHQWTDSCAAQYKVRMLLTMRVVKQDAQEKTSL